MPAEQGLLRGAVALDGAADQVRFIALEWRARPRAVAGIARNRLRGAPKWPSNWPGNTPENTLPDRAYFRAIPGA